MRLPLVALAALIAGSSLVADGMGPTTPEESLRRMSVRPGYRVELAAAEPLVQDPVAMAWAPDGRLWVAEMGDYPLGMDGQGKRGGRVQVLTDHDGDGRYDEAKTFLDNLNFPNGVFPWRKGVLVSAAPDLLYAEDTDGDGQADVRKVLFTGFVEGNQQHRVNGFVWGLDNWVHCANGDSGGTVKSIRTGRTVDIRGRDFRIQPDTGEIELTSGQSQYSKCRDAWGTWFGGNNSNPFWQVVLEDRYLHRNPHLTVPTVLHTPSAVPGAAPVFPRSVTVARFNEPWASNRFTSACGITVDPTGGMIVCEPVHNLVHRAVLKGDEPLYTARRADDESRSEFLASTDPWFRPVQARVGPDGAVWVADMYRAVIEHPQWIPPDWQKRLDLRAGHDRGRIYRIVRIGEKRGTIPRLDTLDTAGLVAALDSPNGWQRDTAQMLLMQKADKSAVPLLEVMAQASTNPHARLHAFCTLDGLGALTAATILRCRSDENPRVIRHLVRLSEPRFAQSPDLGPWVVRQARNPHIAVQAACTLGAWDDPRAGTVLGALARTSDADPFVLTATLSSLTATNFPAVADAALGSGFDRPPSTRLMESLVAFAVGRKDTTTLIRLLAPVTRSDHAALAGWQFDTLAALLDALDRRKMSIADLERGGSEEWKATLARVLKAVSQARRIAVDTTAAPNDRLRAVRLLGRTGSDSAADRKVFADLLGPLSGPDLQAAAVAAVTRSVDAAAPEVLLTRWKEYTPAVRSSVLVALLSRDAWVPTLLEAIAAKRLPAAEVDPAARQRLLTHRTPLIRERAGKLFAGGVDTHRAQVVAAYAPARSATGDAQKGKEVFARVCAACHKIGDIGTAVGPDLAALADKSADYLLTNILDPNRSVEARYVGYTAQTVDGRTLAGFLQAETAASVSLIGTDGRVQAILRSDLESLSSTGRSAMPEGVEKDVSVDQMADLLAFLRGAAPPPKRKEFTGNLPALVRPDPSGALRLPATAAEIYGPSVVFETGHANLGYWGSPEDRAVWSVVVPKAGRYDVWVEWACPADAAGNAVEVVAGGSKVVGRVEASGGWDSYRFVKLGTADVPAGEQRVSVQAAPPLRGYLFDLRAVRLVPAR